MAKLYDQILAQVRIRDVIEHYNIPIIKDKIICPFHDDHNPSMSIDDRKNIVKCFTCGEGGNPITFIYKYETKVNNNPITFNEAVKKAAEIAHLDMNLDFLDRKIDTFQYTSNGKQYNEDQKALLKLNEYFEKVFVNEFIAKSDAQAYLKQRDISLEVAKDLNFGFAPKDIINRIIAHNPKMNQYQLEQLGLIMSNNDGTSIKEPLADRLIIPIKDEKGNTVAFSGRAMHGEEPKYLHVSESPVFHKSNILYNYDKAKAYAYKDNLYIVEGFMDVVGAKVMGIDNVVALMGTELSEEHIVLLKKCNSRITLALDNDEAGKTAMLKHIPRLMKQGFDMSVTDISLLEKGYQTSMKDFGDASATIMNQLEIEQATMPAFSYLLDHQYFANKVYDVASIHQAYQKLKEDKMLTNTYQLALFQEYLMQRTDFTKEALTEIFEPKEIDQSNPLEILKEQALKQYVGSEIKAYLEHQGEPLLSFFYAQADPTIDHLYDIFRKDPEAYLLAEGVLSLDQLVPPYLAQSKEYQTHVRLYGFPHDKVFDHIFYQNQDGKISIALNENQKQQVMDQYETSLNEQERAKLDDVKEMFIINDINDLDAILPACVNPLLKETIQDRMDASKCMQYFKYSTILDPKMIPYVDKDFLNTTGDSYKAILLVNNLSNQLKLTAENYKSPIKEAEKQAEQEMQPEPQKERKQAKEISGKTQNRILISKDAIVSATEKGFQFKTADPDITIYAPASLCYWKNFNQTHLYVIPKLKAFSKSLTTLSKYEKDQYAGRISLDELRSITKFEYDEKSNQQHMDRISLQNVKLINDGQFTHIPAIVDGQIGYFKVNKNYIDADAKTLRGKAEFAYSFYNEANTFVERHALLELPKYIQAYQMLEQTKSLEKDMEMEGF